MNTATGKHIFYGSLIVVLFLGSVSSVFRTDLAAQIVAIFSSLILTTCTALYYRQNHSKMW